ncbi:hypothetical protein ABT186_36015 [Streptomyces sp. NPDC001634]|uniref:hypothetical protein n=1 Tax=Streptomyces sp. NPDC001634 TaxID=3154390 RepID=UPI00332F998E
MDTARGARALTRYTTEPHGNHTLGVGEKKHRVRSRFTFGAVRWNAGSPAELQVTGRCSLGAYPVGALGAYPVGALGAYPVGALGAYPVGALGASLTADGGATAVLPVVQSPHSGLFTVHVPVSELAPGTWSGELRLGEWTVPCRPPRTAVRACRSPGSRSPSSPRRGRVP